MSPLTTSWQHSQCTPDTPLVEVARQMKEQKADHILVYAGERLLGVITRDDVLRYGERGGLSGITADMAYHPL